MRVRVGSLIILCLALVAVPMSAQVLYDDGPVNGQAYAWTINGGSDVSNSFYIEQRSTVTEIEFWAWLLPGDVLQNVSSVGISSQALFGGMTYFSGNVDFSQSNCFTNKLGFDVCQETGNISSGVGLNTGFYWLTLSNALSQDQGPVWWDQNDGVSCMSGGCPSLAVDSTVGTIASEAFTIIGTGSTTPEPSSIMLFCSGILSLAGILRRKLF